MCSVMRYPLALSTVGAAPGTACFCVVAVTTAAAAPTPPSPAARRKSRRLVVLAFFITPPFGRLRFSIQLERFGLDGEERRGQRGDLPVIVRLHGAIGGLHEARPCGREVRLEEAALLLQRRGA